MERTYDVSARFIARWLEDPALRAIVAVPLLLLVLAIRPGPAAGYGEEVDGLPSMHERQIHLFTDMLRVDPMEFYTGADSYEPLHPLVYHPDLNDVARVYADDMKINGCWNADHSSCDGTSFEDRVTAYYPDFIAIGENIAMGHGTPESVVFDGWLHSDGHRANLLHPGFRELGSGYAAGGAGGPWYVQDFGNRSDIEDPLLTSGAHWPDLPALSQPATFYATYHHPDGEAPDSVWVALDTSCYEMELDVGVSEMGVYAWELPEVLEQACVPYAFVATLASGEQVTLPTEGAMVMRAAAADCPDYQPDPPPSPCTGAEDDAPAGCAAQGCEAGTDNSVIDGNDNEITEYGTCEFGARRAVTAPFALLLVAGGLLLATRRLVRSFRP